MHFQGRFPLRHEETFIVERLWHATVFINTVFSVAGDVRVCRSGRTGKDMLLTRLPNGLTVCIVKDTRFPLAATRLYVRTGSAK